MAAKKTISSTSLIMEVSAGTDSKGNAVYTKKTFSNVKPNVDPEKALAVAEAIKAVLSVGVKNYYLRDLSMLSNE